MILADKILNLRRKNGWSQEELAEKLNVSRQSISKWEGAIAIPDINKIIDMAKLFGVTTDYLLKDELSETVYSDEVDDKAMHVSLANANDYLVAMRLFSKRVALGVLLCILSPTILILLAGFASQSIISEALSVSLGLISLFVAVGVAVAIFVLSASKVKKYEIYEKEKFELDYGVNSILKEKKNAYMPKYTLGIALAVLAIILGVLPLIITAIYDAPDLVVISMIDVLLLIVSIATFTIIILGTRKGSYDVLLKEEDYSENKRQANAKLERFSGFYWPVVTAGYLCWSFIAKSWEISWIVWPIAGLIYAGIAALFGENNK